MNVPSPYSRASFVAFNRQTGDDLRLNLLILNISHFLYAQVSLCLCSAEASPAYAAEDDVRIDDSVKDVILHTMSARDYGTKAVSKKVVHINKVTEAHAFANVPYNTSRSQGGSVSPPVRHAPHYNHHV